MAARCPFEGVAHGAAEKRTLLQTHLNQPRMFPAQFFRRCPCRRRGPLARDDQDLRYLPLVLRQQNLDRLPERCGFIRDGEYGRDRHNAWKLFIRKRFFLSLSPHHCIISHSPPPPPAQIQYPWQRFTYFPKASVIVLPRSRIMRPAIRQSVQPASESEGRI